MSSFGIPGFPQDDKFWRIEWIDNPITYPDDEIRIKLYLSQLIDDFEKPLNNSSLYFHHGKPLGQEVVVKIGFLPFFKIGSIWKNGIQQPELPSYFHSFKFSFSLKDTEELVLTRYGQYGRKPPNEEITWEDILISKDYRIAGKDVLKRKSVVVVHNCGGFSEVIIPSIVIFQSCYISSFKAASKIIFGQIEKMIDPNFSGMLEEYPDVFKACLFKDYKDEEALILGNLYVNEIAKKEIKKLRNNLKLQKNSLSESITSVRVNFPFDHIDISAEGKILPNKDNDRAGRRFFVTRLNVLKADFPFIKICIERKNDGRKGKEIDDDLQPAYSGNKPKIIGNNPLDVYQIVDEDVSINLDQVQFDFLSGVNIQGIEFVKDEKETQQYKSATLVKQDNQDIDLISTGDARNTGTGARGITEKDKEPPISLDEFIQILSYCKDAGLNIKSIPISSSYHVYKGCIVNEYFRVTSVNSWNKTEDKSRYRYFIVAELYYKGTYNYLVDLEPKGTSALSIILFRSKNGMSINSEQLVFFMRDTAKFNAWPLDSNQHSYQSAWFIERMQHNRKGVNQTVVDTILKKLNL